MPRLARIVLRLGTCLALLACGDTSRPTEATGDTPADVPKPAPPDTARPSPPDAPAPIPPGPRAQFVVTARPVVTDHDTVGTELPGVLAATVYDSAGRPAAGVSIAVRPLLVAGGPEGARYLGYRPASAPSPAWITFITTVRADSGGTIRLEFKLGTAAGEARAVLSATGPGVFAVDTVRFTVRPGAPARLEILPRDSAVYVDRSYSIRARVLDGHGNPSAVAPTLRSDSGAVTLTAQGVLTGARVGRAVVRAAFERLADSAWVSVVPRGTLAATRRPGELVQFGLDGSDVGVLAARAVGEATWAPAGGGMAFVDRSQGDYFYGGRVFVRDAGGAEAPLLADYTPYETQRTPAFSRDGAWVYFAGRATHTSIMRARLNGGGLEAVATPAPPGSPWYTDTSAAPDGAYHSYADPAPSPDGRYLAYSGLASCCVPWVIYVRELATGRTTKRPGAELPKWLPGTDTLVAHSAAGFVLVRPDGSTVRSVAYPAVTTLGGMLFDVAPDGRWLAVSANIEGPSRRIELLSLETGMRLPLAFTTDMGSPAWRP